MKTPEEAIALLAARAEAEGPHTEDECYVAEHMLQLDFEMLDDNGDVFGCTLGQVLELLRARGGGIARRSAALEASDTLAIAKQLADERRKTQELLVAIQPFLEFNASTKYINITVKSDDIARARRAFSEGSK